MPSEKPPPPSSETDALRERVEQLERELELLRAEQLAEHNEQARLLRSIAATVPGLIYLSDLDDDRIIWSNASFADRLGYPESDWENLRRTDLIHPEDRKWVAQAVESLRDSANEDLTVRSEVRLRHKDGSWRWFAFRDRGFERTEEGRLTKLIGTATDITERRENAEVAERSRILYRSIAANIPGGFVVVFNRNLDFVLAEGPFLRELGYRRSDIEGRNTREPLPDGKTWRHLEPHFRRVLRGQTLQFEADEGEHKFLMHLVPRPQR